MCFKMSPGEPDGKTEYWDNFNKIFFLFKLVFFNYVYRLRVYMYFKKFVIDL